MYKRTGSIVFRKFGEFFVPTVIIMASHSLSLIINSIIAGKVLGPAQMSAVSVASPITLCVTTVCALLGVGASVLISISKGERDNLKANKLFTLAIIGLAAFGVFGVIIGLSASNQIARLLTGGGELYLPTSDFLKVYLLGSPIIALVFSIPFLLRADGFPKLASNIMVVGNAINVALSYIFMKYLGFGIGGAALANVVGYLSASLLLIYYFKSEQRTLKFVPFKTEDFGLYPEIAAAGFANALSQALMFAKTLFINNVVLTTAGTSGMVALSVCNSCFRLASMCISGTSQTLIPLAGTFFGEKDMQGVKYAVMAAARVVLTLCVGLTVLMQIFPGQILALHNVTNPEEVAIGIQAIRIYSLCFVGMGFSFLMMNYTQTIKRRKLSMAICVCEGFLAIVPICWILTRNFGVVGVWSSYVAAEIVTAILIFTVSGVIVRRSNGKLHGLFMFDNAYSAPMVDATIHFAPDEAVGLSEQVIKLCGDNGLSSKQAHLLGIMTEDMAMNIIEYNKRNPGAKRFGRERSIDICLRVFENEITITFRDDGKPFDPMVYTDEEKDIYTFNNIDMVKKLATNVSYSRVIGLNCTTVSLSR